MPMVRVSNGGLKKQTITLGVQGSVYGRTAIFEWTQEIPLEVKLISLTGGATFYARDDTQGVTLSVGQTFTRSANATKLEISIDAGGGFARHDGIVEVYY